MINKAISESAVRVILKCHERGISGSSIVSQFTDWLKKNNLQEDWVGETKKTEDFKPAPVVRKGAIRVMVDENGDVVSQGEFPGELAENNILSMQKPKPVYASPEDEDFLDPTAGPKDPEEEEKEEGIIANRDEFFNNGIPVKWEEDNKVWTGTAYSLKPEKMVGDCPTVFCECNEDGLFKDVGMDCFWPSSAKAIKKKFGLGSKDEGY